jgi:hypothetical protein
MEALQCVKEISGIRSGTPAFNKKGESEPEAARVLVASGARVEE